MRAFGVFALVFVAGCSLLWDMDPYEGGARPAAGATDDGGSSSSSSGGGRDANASSSGGPDAAVVDAAGSDAGSCFVEEEPNDSTLDAQDIPVGRTCGVIASAGDMDFFATTTTSPIKLTIELGVNVQMIAKSSGVGSQVYQDPGTVTLTYGAGTHELSFQTFNGSLGGYAITR